jgi:hypothetical protein
MYELELSDLVHFLAGIFVRDLKTRWGRGVLNSLGVDGQY